MNIRIIPLLLATATFPGFAGEMGFQDISEGKTYVMIGGGYYAGQYQSNFTSYESNSLITKQSFDDSFSSGYGQIGIGTNSRIGGFIFDHQLAVGKLWGAESIPAPSTSYNFKQKVDFGYDLMPKMKLFRLVNAFGVLGVHYARFHYNKAAYNTNITGFDNDKDQLGFNLGAGIDYNITNNVSVGVKYQHLQYQAVQVNGASSTGSAIDIENITPVFNLVGLELRYYWR